MVAAVSADIFAPPAIRPEGVTQSPFIYMCVNEVLAPNRRILLCG
jgi:hypothetical protein